MEFIYPSYFLLGKILHESARAERELDTPCENIELIDFKETTKTEQSIKYIKLMSHPYTHLTSVYEECMAQ